MAITPQFTKEDVTRRFDKFIEVVEEEQIRLLEYLGEKSVIEARINHSYQDQTGALTGSIGYMLFKDGEAIKGNFEIKGGQTPDFVWGVSEKGKTSLTGGSRSEKSTPEEGSDKGKALAEKIGAQTTGLSLVVVAGMQYAVYVEAKGFNVLASAEHLAEQELPKLLKDLIEDIKKA